MKYFFKVCWFIFCYVMLALYLVSCFSAFIPPSQFSFIAIFSYSFPLLFSAVISCCIVSFFISKRFSLYFFVIIIICGYRNLINTVAFNFSQKWQNNKSDSVLRIMTWNVQDFIDLNFTSTTRESMINLIHQYNPDILCVQEFTNVEGGKWRVSVRHELDSIGYIYHLFSNDQVTSNPFDKQVMRGAAIFSKTPFNDSGRISICDTGMPENLIYVNVTLNYKPLKIYTAHLASFALYRDTIAQGSDIYKITYARKRIIQYKLRETEQLHQQEVNIIHDQISQSTVPVVYCGDMNTTPCSYNYRFLKDNLQDAFLKEGSGIGSTFYKILPTLRIDVCFADTSFKINQCTVINRNLSDHYPLLTDVSWK